jgi:hypothetical protein
MSPPSTLKDCPVMFGVPSEARKAAMPAMSSGCSTGGGNRRIHPGRGLGLGDLLALGHALDDPVVHRGPRDAGTDGVHVDVEPGKLGGGDPRHGDHGARGARVGDVGGARNHLPAMDAMLMILPERFLAISRAACMREKTPLR